MAETIGHCRGCGQEFTWVPDSRYRSGYSVMERAESATRLQCNGCGRTVVVTHS